MAKNYLDNQVHIEVPDYVEAILVQLTLDSHEAYIVGGCVRDALIGREPKDWDICTSALPEEVIASFPEERIVKTGLQHGTVTVLVDHKSIEVTTYRIDGDYIDNRHPEQVEFTHSLKEDLARRDFTINAMAYHPEKGLVDFYDGQTDLRYGLIRCVGNPRNRFSEDALRIMRGLRFASELGFSIEEETTAAIHGCREPLKVISKERIHAELSKLLMGQNADQVLVRYKDILEIAAQGIQVAQVNSFPTHLGVRLAAVFPENTEVHLRNLKYDNSTIKTAAILSKLAEAEPPTENDIAIKRFLQEYGEEIAKLHYKRAGKLEQLETLLQKEPCYQIKDLAVGGDDLMEAGIAAGPELGQTLAYLLDQVIEEKVENEKEALLFTIKAKEAR